MPGSKTDGRHIVLAAPDGDSAGPWAAAAFASWSKMGSVVALDLPLSGSRSSDKLSATAFTPGDPLGERVRDLAVAQLRADLEALRAWLASRGLAGPSAYVASGRGALLSKNLEPCFDVVIEFAQGEDPQCWAEDVATELHDRLSGSPV